MTFLSTGLALTGATIVIWLGLRLASHLIANLPTPDPLQGDDEFSAAMQRHIEMNRRHQQ